jgi:hypothetical protein
MRGAAVYTYEAGKGEFEKEEVGRALVTTNFTQSQRARTVTFGFALSRRCKTYCRWC